MKISLIICSRNRALVLERCLSSIATAITAVQSLDVELVVVNNGSVDDTSVRVKKFADGQCFPVRLVFEGRKGLSRARNRGLREARGDLLVFTDDDCCLSADYFCDLIKQFESAGEPVLLGGRVELGDPNDLPLSIKTVEEEQVWKKSDGSARTQNMGDSLVGCNMVMPRELVRRLGPFDERLGAGSSIPGGEDTDYIFRAYEKGFTIRYVPDMTVLHFHGRKGVSEGMYLFRCYAQGWGALYTKHLFSSPSLCRPFYWDLKNAIREILTGKNSFMPSMNFSHKDKVLYSLLGALKFLCAVVANPFQRTAPLPLEPALEHDNSTRHVA